MEYYRDLARCFHLSFFSWNLRFISSFHTQLSRSLHHRLSLSSMANQVSHWNFFTLMIYRICSLIVRAPTRCTTQIHSPKTDLQHFQHNDWRFRRLPRRWFILHQICRLLVSGYHIWFLCSPHESHRFLDSLGGHRYFRGTPPMFFVYLGMILFNLFFLYLEWVILSI